MWKETAEQMGRLPFPLRSPRERLAPYVPLLERAGWTLHVTADDQRGRTDAFHPDGAIAMVNARPDRPHGVRARAGSPPAMKLEA